jgi:hypothetical protein
VAEITAEVFAVTEVVVIVNVAVLSPAATVTLAGTCATAGLLPERVTSAPPAGAIPVNVTVPVEFAPPTTVAGLSASEESLAGFTVNVAVAVVPYVPEMVTAVPLVTAPVVTAKVAVVVPAATVTLVGTCATPVLLLESVTTAPPEGATPLNVTVPVELLPPTTLVGLSVTDDSVVGGVTVKIALCVPP